MSDSHENRSPSGSWQPDPSGRHKLRWRDKAGVWTHHVYSDDGKLGSDLYAPPAEPTQQERPPGVTTHGPAPKRATMRLLRRHDLMLVTWIAAGVGWFCILYGPWPWDVWLGTQNLGDWLARGVTLVTLLALWATVSYFRARRQMRSAPDAGSR